MKTNYSIITLVTSLLYAIVLNWLPDFPVNEDVFQVLIGYLVIKVFSANEVPEMVGLVKNYFSPVAKSKKLK
jgi:hypothetical protein